MTDAQGRPSGTGWAWLLALPVLCCAGHAVLLALGAGSVAAAVGGTTGRVALLAGGGVVALAAGLVLARRKAKV